MNPPDDTPEMHWFDALLLRMAPYGLIAAAVCFALAFLLLAIAGAWTIKDAIW